MLETNTNPDFHGLPQKNLIVERKGKIHLQTISVWSRFISIALIIVVTIFLVAVIYNYYNDFIEIEAETDQSNYNSYHLATILLFLLLYYPAIRLFNFSRCVDHAILFRESSDLTKALRHLKSFVQVIGIITSLLLVGYLFLIVYTGFWLKVD